ncbi:MAG: argininosuccinate lyase, partial [Nitrospinae bacterium]|nr:argininosuccinate lyase [Nitrospinota bacterium]
MSQKKLWSGRFTEPTHPLVEAFNASIGFDIRLYAHDIKGSVAHARMLGRQGIIPKREADAIVKGLLRVEAEIRDGAVIPTAAHEDVHMFVEGRLTENLGPVAGKLHTGRSRNDQVATAFRLWTRDAVDRIAGSLRRVQGVMADRAAEHLDTLAPSYTHLQPAQPIRLAHWFLAYYDMFGRDAARLADARKRVNVMPLGSAALAGTNFPIDRAGVAKELGFAAITTNSLDAVSDRDFAAEFLFCLALVGTHLSRLAEELILFTTAEFAVMELPDAFCTGSSIMPQKKNPDVPELFRGKSGRLYGALMSMLTTLKGLPLAYNKDLQEDKEPVFDAARQVETMLELAADMMAVVKVDTGKLAARAEKGYMTAVDVADR